MKKILLLLLAAGSLNLISCEAKKTGENGSADISVSDMENSTAATDKAETTTAAIDSTAIITADTTGSDSIQ